MIETSTTQEIGPVAAEMIARLKGALAPVRLELEDESEAHRGHSGHDARGESHFRLTIQSADFAGKSRIERQRMVYKALGELMNGRIHALSIAASAPGEK